MPTPNQLRELLFEFADSVTDRDGMVDGIESMDFQKAMQPIENYVSQVRKEAVEEGTKVGLMKALSFKIPKNPCSIDYADGFTACQTMCLNAAHSKDEKLGK